MRIFYSLMIMIGFGACQSKPTAQAPEAGQGDMVAQLPGSVAAVGEDTISWDIITLQKIDSIRNRYEGKALEYTRTDQTDITGDDKKEKIVSRIFLLNDTFYTCHLIFSSGKEGVLLYADTTAVDNETVVTKYYNDPLSRKLYYRKLPYSAFYEATRMLNIVVKNANEQELDLLKNTAGDGVMINELSAKLRQQKDNISEEEARQLIQNSIVNYKGKLLSVFTTDDYEILMWIEPLKQFVSICC